MDGNNGFTIGLLDRRSSSLFFFFFFTHMYCMARQGNGLVSSFLGGTYGIIGINMYDIIVAVNSYWFSSSFSLSHSQRGNQ